MAIINKRGILYCSKCKRECDKTCWELPCSEYKRCNTCKYAYDNESGYCDDCSIGDNDLWEDKYVHTGKF